MNNNYIHCKKNKYTYLNEKDIFLVGKSSLHIVSGEGFYNKVNLSLLDTGDYYFTFIKQQIILTKSDIIKNNTDHILHNIEWCLLINFIEFHLSMKLNIPVDINLNGQTNIFYHVNDKIMKQNKTKEENMIEFTNLWSTGKLLTYYNE